MPIVLDFIVLDTALEITHEISQEEFDKMTDAIIGLYSDSRGNPKNRTVVELDERHLKVLALALMISEWGMDIVHELVKLRSKITRDEHGKIIAPTVEMIFTDKSNVCKCPCCSRRMKQLSALVKERYTEMKLGELKQKHQNGGNASKVETPTSENSASSTPSEDLPPPKPFSFDSGSAGEGEPKLT